MSTEQTVTASSWHTETGDRTRLLEIRPDVDPDVVPGCAYIELSHEDDGPVEMWLNRRQVLDAMTALARIAGCEVTEEHRIRYPHLRSAEGPWVRSPLSKDEGTSYVVEHRFVITTPAEEVATRA